MHLCATSLSVMTFICCDINLKCLQTNSKGLCCVQVKCDLRRVASAKSRPESDVSCYSFFIYYDWQSWHLFMMLHSICHRQSDRLWTRLRTKRLTQEMDQRVYSIWLDAHGCAVCDVLCCEMYKLHLLLVHDQQVTLAAVVRMSERDSSLVDNAQAQL